MVKPNKIVTGLIAGVAVGAVAGLLFAPKPGKASRKIVASRAGEIRYKAGGAGMDDSVLGVATRALSNFEFDSLSSEVTYSERGDLLLGVRLEGVNPNLDPNQPVVLNLNVENNVPEMLRSMRATRSIEEVFQRRLNNE